MSDVMKSVFQVNNKKTQPQIPSPSTTTRTNQTRLAENDIEWDLAPTLRSNPRRKNSIISKIPITTTTRIVFLGGPEQETVQGFFSQNKSVEDH